MQARKQYQKANEKQIERLKTNIWSINVSRLRFL